jgi:RNA polymerase sigma factor (sigma-70 family)
MATDTPTVSIRGAIDAVWRIEQAKLIAGLARIVRDVALAEELAQDALVAALEQWPTSGIPEKPGAWLMTTARRRAIDRLRRHKLAERKHAEIGRDLDSEQESALARIDDALDDDIGDDLLRLMFTACHPVLSTDARVALTLRLVGGLTTDEIARAFLVPEPTVAQRLVRAKRTLTDKRVPFEVPRGAIAPSVSPRCSKCSTSCSTRATPRPPATTGCGRSSARTRCGWAACSRASRPTSRRCTGWSR